MRDLLRVTALAAAIAACGPTSSKPEGDDVDDVDASTGSVVEICDNGFDDDRNGMIDEGCTCFPGATSPCFSGDPATIGVGACKAGQQKCAGTGESGTWGACEGGVGPAAEVCNEIDDDCNGVVDDLNGGTPCMIIDVAVNIDGDCVTASCPANAPYPIGCSITMSGGDPRGCVASTATSSVVYFQEGDKCGAGHVGGTLKCATVPGSGLTAQNCTINKSQTFYPTAPSGCPALQ
jgi:hypothetical protein